MKVCLDCHRATKSTRCSDCERKRDKARGTRSERGYGAGHSALRRDYQHRMNRGETFDCWRCGDPIDPTHWHLGHNDEDRSKYRGPECVPCNLATSGRIYTD